MGGLTLAEATAKLEAELAPRFLPDIVVRAGGERISLPVKKLKFAFRADRTAQRAYDAGLAAPANPDGTLPPASATPSVSFRRDPCGRGPRSWAARSTRRRATRAWGST